MGPPPSSTGHTQARAHLEVGQDQGGDLPPVGFPAAVVHGRRSGVGEGVHARSLAEDLLVVLDGLGQLVRGTGPAQLAVGVGQHDPGGETSNSCRAATTAS